MNTNDEKLIAVRLLQHLENVNYTGLDPSLIRYNPQIEAILNYIKWGGMPRRIWGGVISKSIDILGHRIHGFFKLEKARLPKCLALSALAHLSLYKQTRNKESLAKGLVLIKELTSLSVNGSRLWAHGVPYKMRGENVSEQTPNLVTTFFVSQAIYGAAAITKQTDLIQLFQSIVENAFECFPARQSPQGFCFMYTPTTTYFVHNANLMMVQMVGQYWYSGGTSIAESTVFSALKYSLDDFVQKRKLPYAGMPTINNKEDNYHTGFILRSLGSIKTFEPFSSFMSDISDVLCFGIQRYWTHFSKREFIRRDKSGKINSHSLAEAILMKKAFGVPQNIDIQLIDTAIKNTLTVLWNKSDKRFDDQVQNFYGISIRNKADFPRWSQAWMAYALARPPCSAEPL